jgi:hypothetical protein
MFRRVSSDRIKVLISLAVSSPNFLLVGAGTFVFAPGNAVVLLASAKRSVEAVGRFVRNSTTAVSQEMTATNAP